MSRRKDNKGRVLRTGESQRKDLIYQYRYTDALGNRKCIYASDLKTLREKEDELQRSLEDGLDYAGGEITVYELLQRYLSLKCGVRYNTKVGYGFVMNIVQKEPFGARKIRDIKVSDAQRWMIKLQKEGKGYSTLTSIRGVVKPAFQMAYNEEVVRRNPFDFKLTDVVANDSQKRISLTEKQQKVWMNFIREDKSYAKYYDETVVLLSHKKADSYIHIDVEFGEGEGKIPVDSIAKRAEAYKPKEKVTYKMIKEYIEAKYGFKVHTAYIAEVKRNLGLPMYDAPNAVEELKQPRKHPTPEKVEAIKDALRYFAVI